MSLSGLGRMWTYLAGMQWVMLLLLAGLIAFSVALVVLIWTRWGTFRPLRKCLLLSLLGHLLFAGYATTVEIVGWSPEPREHILHISLVEGIAGTDTGQSKELASKASDNSETDEAPDADPIDLSEANRPSVPPPAKPIKKPASEPSTARPPKSTPAEVQDAQPIVQQLDPETDEPIDWATAETGKKILDEFVDSQQAASKAAADSAATTAATALAATASHALLGTSPNPKDGQPSDMNAEPRSMPEAYKLRVAADHLSVSHGDGGSPEAEAAVQAALKWFAASQSPDGHWSARQFEAGQGIVDIDGNSRPHAGIDADTGMTGLALLSLLASGDTHLRGPYQENVRIGLEYLLRTQEASGCLSGSADRFAAMYCHAMAAFALSEAYGMSGDPRLELPVRRAIAYTISAQDPIGGGWRYRPRDPGDMSQLGWQFMALKSAELAGIPIPTATRRDIIRYLQSVGSGQYGGMASYRPGPHEAPSRTMTAEALVCWQFLGIAREHPACNEAGDFIAADLPGTGPANFYYWYYGTLAIHQLQGERWRRWNEAIQRQLLTTQRTSGPFAGSWDPDSIWGPYGGRIYSTALATLCLEVYYRYLPLYGNRVSARPVTHSMAE